jgi:alpha-beta hydrolase superfamily lysophospholipase
MRPRLFAAACTLALTFILSLSSGSPANRPKMKSKRLTTASGVAFRLLGERGPRPAPTLFMFGSSAQDSVELDSYNTLGHILAREGYISVGIDTPGHGEDVRPGEPQGLLAWRTRLEKAEDFLGAFKERFTAVLDYLVHKGYSDPQRIVISGSSRGGFLALHTAAGEPRALATIVFAPVTDLLAVREFKGMKDPSAAARLDVMTLTGKLTDRPLWLAISYNDERVGTRHAIDFTVRMMELSRAYRKPMIGSWSDDETKLILSPARGAEGHSTFEAAHEEAAAWLLRRFGKR